MTPLRTQSAKPRSLTLCRSDPGLNDVATRCMFEEVSADFSNVDVDGRALVESKTDAGVCVTPGFARIDKGGDSLSFPDLPLDYNFYFRRHLVNSFQDGCDGESARARGASDWAHDAGP